MKFFKFILLSCLTMTIHQAKAIQSGDVLLVYFSDQASTNHLYYELLKFKFPALDVREINSEKEFYNYVPKNVYEQHIASYGGINRENINSKLKNLPDLKSFYEDLNQALKDTGKTKAFPSCYFFDLKSDSKTMDANIVGSNGTTQRNSYVVYQYKLQLVHSDGSHFTETSLFDLDIKEDFYGKDQIPPGQMDNASDWINPVMVSIYLHSLFEKNYFTPDPSSEAPCDIEADDSIYLCSIMNREYLKRALWAEPKEKTFKRHVKPFKHPHIKLTNAEFGLAALEKIKNKQHFYLFFYSNEPTYAFYIIDLLTFKILYYNNKEVYDVLFDKTVRHRIKKISRFRKRCKR